MKSILSVTASGAMKWMIGSRPKRSSEESRLLGELQRKQSRKHEIAQSAQAAVLSYVEVYWLLSVASASMFASSFFLKRNELGKGGNVSVH